MDTAETHSRNDVSDDVIERVRRWIDAAEKVVVLTGAGISTDSGIPDFRGPQGLWTLNPAAEKLSTLQCYLSDREVRKAAWRSRLTHPAWHAKPNAGHLALVTLERRGKLNALITQNIDELHQIAGNSPQRVIEVHGTIRKVTCWECGWTGPMLTVLERVSAGEADPACERCAGILKSATISFGQPLQPEVIERAMRCAGEANLFMAIGTSLNVFPIAGALPAARAGGAQIVILNAEPTAMDKSADALLRGPISTLLPKIVAPG